MRSCGYVGAKFSGNFWNVSKPHFLPSAVFNFGGRWELSEDRRDEIIKLLPCIGSFELATMSCLLLDQVFVSRHYVSCGSILLCPRAVCAGLCGYANARMENAIEWVNRLSASIIIIRMKKKTPKKIHHIYHLPRHAHAPLGQKTFLSKSRLSRSRTLILLRIQEQHGAGSGLF